MKHGKWDVVGCAFCRVGDTGVTGGCLLACYPEWEPYDVGCVFMLGPLRMLCHTSCLSRLVIEF